MDNMTKKAVWKIMAAILGLLLAAVFAAIALLLLWPSLTGGMIKGMETTKTELQAAAPKQAEIQVRDEIRIAGAQQAEQTGEDGEETGDYIIADSGTKLLSDADISGLSAKQLNYAKNEIYARHGRKFDSKELQDYFNSKSWYNGQYEPDDFDKESDSILSDVEKKNAEFLKDAEQAAGGYSLDQ